MEPQMSAAETEEARNKRIVERYFHEVLDRRRFDLLPVLLAPGVIVHRPGFDATGLEVVTRNLRARLEDYTGFSTELSGLMAEGDMVSVRVLHRTRVRPHTFRSRAGEVQVKQEQELGWAAIVQFRLQDGKIAEEWVMRDELGMLVQMGAALVGK